jgi:hypothetical protein
VSTRPNVRLNVREIRLVGEFFFFLESVIFSKIVMYYYLGCLVAGDCYQTRCSRARRLESAGVMGVPGRDDKRP